MTGDTEKTIKNRRKWRDSIKVTETILTITEIWPKEKRNFLGNVKASIFLISCLIFDITVLEELRVLLRKQDYEALSMHLSTLGLFIGYTVKIILFQFKKNTAMKSMLNSIDQPIFEDYPEGMQWRKDKCIYVSNGVALFYVSCVAASILLYLNKPFYTSYPLPITFSHELNPVLFYALLVLECFCCYYLVMIGISFDMIIIGLINIATSQLDILSESIGSFKPKSLENREQEEHDFFSKCTIRHQAVIQFIEETENVFSFIFLAQCLASVTSICNGMFQLAHTGRLFSIHFYFNCAFTFDVLFEIGICCWFATLLTLKSLEVADACFNYNWIHSSTHTKKLLLITLCRSQKPLYITAGKVIRLSMAAYLSVLKTAYSYFALMQSLYYKKQE